MGNVTVITGGTSGIGKAIVEKIASVSQEGDKIIIIYANNDENAQKMITDNKGACHIEVVKADLSEYSSIKTVVEKVQAITEHIDWLVLNTGVGTYLPFEEYTYDIWDKVMRTNVNVPAMLVKELKPFIAEKGNILFMGSHAGQAPYSSSVVYSVSKAAVHFLAKSLVKCFDDKLVSVNAVAPGFIETRWQEGRSDESRARVNRKIAAHRFGTPEEVADLAYAILNNDYLNGSIYDVHGGYDYF